MAAFIDFKWVVQHADVLAVLDQLGIQYKRGGQEARYRCHTTDHDDKQASCSINTENRMFMCQGCKATGDILDVAATMLGAERRSAAMQIAEWSNIGLANPNRRDGRKAAPSGGGRRPTHRKQTEPEPWKPFTTLLRLDGDHPFGANRYSPEMIQVFAMGYQDKGSFGDRWCVPVHDAAGNQLGYFGRSVGDAFDDNNPKWKIPFGFPKSQVLFNLHRVLAADTHDGALIVVEGIGDAIALHDRGLPVVACLGSSLSEAQAAIIAEHDFLQVCLLFDGDDPGRAGAPAAASLVAPHAFVRIAELPDGIDPEDADDDQLADALWWL